MLALKKKQSAHEWEVLVATPYHVVYASMIADMIEQANQEPGVVLALRSAQYIAQAMKKEQAVIALDSLGQVIGFCVIKLWDDGKFISNSGLVVTPMYRKQGVGSAIIKKLYELCSEKYPESILFSLTDSEMVIKTREAMGFVEAPYDQITQDSQFWAGCQTCPHHGTLMQNDGKSCECSVLVKQPGGENDFK